MAVSFQRGCHKVNRILEPRSQFPHSPSKSDPLQDASMYSNEQTKNCVIGCDTRCRPTWAHTYIIHILNTGYDGMLYLPHQPYLQQPATAHATGRSWPSEDSVKRGSWPSEEQKKSPWPSEAPLGKGFWQKSWVFFSVSQCGFGPDFWSYFIDGLCFMLLVSLWWRCYATSEKVLVGISSSGKMKR